MRDVAALIVAAGEGRRFGGEVPKVFVELAGVPLFVWALRACGSCPAVNRLLLAVGEAHLPRAADLLRSAGLDKPVALVTGGARRQDTVRAGLRALQPDPPAVIAIQDGARPLTDPATISGSVALARECGGCVTAVPVTDTLKRAGPDRMVCQTPDRALFWRAQTPQTFRYDLLAQCYDRVFAEGWEVTDDASALEMCGQPVCINPGCAENIKVTTPEDLLYAEALLAAQSGARAAPLVSPGGSPGAVRVGHGYDVHALVPGRNLILGGVPIAHETGLAGHSDADVLLHALCDALLGAAALGDIGQLFPDSDPAYAGIDSAILCRQVARRVRERGFEIGNVDATLVAQRPRLAPHIPAMRDNIVRALDISLEQVSVKATTTERLGFAGREEGIAAEAVATLVVRVTGSG